MFACECVMRENFISGYSNPADREPVVIYFVPSVVFSRVSTNCRLKFLFFRSSDKHKAALLVPASMTKVEASGTESKSSCKRDILPFQVGN